PPLPPLFPYTTLFRSETSASFRQFRHGRSFDHTKDRTLKRYRRELLEALEEVELQRHRVVAASVFTTQSVTAVLEKIRHQIRKGRPAPATMLGTFPLSNIVAIRFERQVGIDPTAATSFSTSFV